MAPGVQPPLLLARCFAASLVHLLHSSLLTRSVTTYAQVRGLHILLPGHCNVGKQAQPHFDAQFFSTQARKASEAPVVTHRLDIVLQMPWCLMFSDDKGIHHIWMRVQSQVHRSQPMMWSHAAL